MRKDRGAGRLTEILLATPGAENLIRNSVPFSRAVHAVEYAEREGRDPLPVLADALAVICTAYEKVVDRAVECEMRTVRPMTILGGTL